LFTIPFYTQNSSSELRSALKNGEIIHIKSPQFETPQGAQGAAVLAAQARYH
jgi:hypothetical protein